MTALYYVPAEEKKKWTASFTVDTAFCTWKIMPALAALFSIVETFLWDPIDLCNHFVSLYPILFNVEAI